MTTLSRITNLARPLILGLLVTAVICTAADAALGCPSCKEALAGSEGDQAAGGDIIAGYFWSILFMMSMPFTILGCFSGYMYLEVRRARAAREAPNARLEQDEADCTCERELVEV